MSTQRWTPYIKHRLVGEQEQLARKFLLLFSLNHDRTGGFTLQKSLFIGIKHLKLHLRRLVTTCLCSLLSLCKPCLYGLKVFELKLIIDNLHVAHRVHRCVDMCYIIIICNVDDASAVNGNHYVEAVREAIAGEGADLMIVAAKTESEIAELDTWEERKEFLEEIGLSESGVSRLIRAAYSLLDLQTYFTAGADEVRAWTFMRGTKAPQAAGIIHTDFEKGFIRAEVIKYEDYVSLGSEAAVKEAGKMGVEGKEYVVQDGDIMHFRFNV